MRKIKLEEVGGALILECYTCKMTMPYMGALTDGKRIYCHNCAEISNNSFNDFKQRVTEYFEEE